MKLGVKVTIVCILLILALLVQVSDPVAQGLAAATRPFLKGFDAVGEGVAYVTGFVPVGKRGRRELERLEKENAALQTRLHRQQVFRRQNEDLRKLLNLEQPPVWDKTYASVIVRDPLTWEQKFRIGKGSEEGVVPGAAVLEKHYVIGRIVSVSAHTATVATLADRECRISVRLEKSGGVGILEGRAGERRDGKPVCVITYLPRDAQYVAGDRVLTSGMSRVVPAGLPLGNSLVWDNKKTVDFSAGTHARVKYLPAGAFEDFRFVTVISKRSRGNDAD